MHIGFIAYIRVVLAVCNAAAEEHFRSLRYPRATSKPRHWPPLLEVLVLLCSGKHELEEDALHKL